MTKLRALGNLLWVAVTCGLLTLSPAQAADEIVYFHVDALGSATAAFNENGDVCWKQNYTPYGGQTSDEDANPPEGCGLIGKDRGYTGHVQDESGLTYMQQRYYDASIGRFLSIDPVGVNADVTTTYNRYMYANNNPYKYIDPDGQLAFIPYLIAGALIVADVAIQSVFAPEVAADSGQVQRIDIFPGPVSTPVVAGKVGFDVGRAAASTAKNANQTIALGKSIGLDSFAKSQSARTLMDDPNFMGTIFTELRAGTQFSVDLTGIGGKVDGALTRAATGRGSPFDLELLEVRSFLKEGGNPKQIDFFMDGQKVSNPFE